MQPPRKPMNPTQRTALAVALVVIALAAILLVLFGGNKGPDNEQRPGPSPAPTYATVEQGIKDLPTPTPTPSPTPSPSPSPSPSPTPAPIPVLKKGSKGVQVVALQARLIELGFLPAGSNDGDYGSGTEAAVRDFQATNSLKDDGIAGPQTQELLFSKDAKPKPKEGE